MVENETPYTDSQTWTDDKGYVHEMSATKAGLRVMRLQHRVNGNLVVDVQQRWVRREGGWLLASNQTEFHVRGHVQRVVTNVEHVREATQEQRKIVQAAAHERRVTVQGPDSRTLDSLADRHCVWYALLTVASFIGTLAMAEACLASGGRWSSPARGSLAGSSSFSTRPGDSLIA
jgi:type II secretory pathway component PulK